VNLLLDSHTLLWLMAANPSLSGTAAALIGDPANRLHLSMASAWEIAIKVGLKKMGLSVPFATFLATAITGYGLVVVPITTDDCVSYAALPFPDPKHRDPFDRMIAIHALRNKLSLVGNDSAFDLYGVTPLW
jgi:PIN domain nuclease of toxin-antitoxin system